MSGSGEGWAAFDAAMRDYVEEFAALSAATGSKMVQFPRWVRRNDRYVRDEGNVYQIAQSVSNQAFHLKSFQPLLIAFLESPLKAHSAGVVHDGSGPQIMLHPQDVAFRLASNAVKVELNGSQRLDREAMEMDIDCLHELVEAKTLPMEVIGYVLGAQVLEPIRLRSDLRVEPLPESEIGPFLNFLPLPMTINKSTQEWEVLPLAPVAIIRLDFEQPWDQPWLDPSNVLRAEFEWFADAVALHHDARPVLFLERRWHRRDFLRRWWSDTPSNGTGLVEKSAVVVEVASVVEACAALRKLAADEAKSAVPTAIRRLGLTRTRASSDDVLIDTVIALEALLLERKERESLANRMATRAAQWATEWGADCSTVYGLAKNAYNMRSNLVHGETPKKDAVYKIGDAVLGYEALVSQVADLARTIGSDALKRSLDGTFAAHQRSILDTAITKGSEIE